VLPPAALRGQDSVDPNRPSSPSEATTSSKFGQAEASAQQRLEASLAELSALREDIAAEQIPFSQNLRDLEDRLIEVRRNYQETTRLLDTRTLDLSNLRAEIKSRQEEKTYLANLLGEYIRNFESRLHIAELQRYREPLESAKLAPENSNLSEVEVFAAQADLVQISLKRLEEALGGARFDGQAVDTAGLVKQGSFVLMGPAVLFCSKDGTRVGTAEQRLGSLEPTIIGFESAAMTAKAAEMVQTSTGAFPLDPTLGNAHKIEATKQTLLEHIQKGGVVMYPILGLFAVAMLIALYKWVELALLRTPTENSIEALMQAVGNHDEQAAAAAAAAIGGPAGDMLAQGVVHIQDPPELVEEVMFEKILTAKLKLQRFLPFIAVSAASAPLLGLLGTVTGIINTFKLITVFGSGDVKTLSGGISEALITTEFGLIVAIPSLLLHAFLSRKARGMIDRMEKAAIRFMNQLNKTPYRQEHTNQSLAQLSAAQVQEIIRSIRQHERGESHSSIASYAENAIGRFMEETVVTVGKSATVDEAIGKIRTAALGEDEDKVFVVDDQGQYVGDLRIRQLLLRPENTPVASLLESQTHVVQADTDKQEVVSLLTQHNLTVLPVVDREGRLVGRVTRNRNGNGNGGR
jgi:biopolymer transport protein ExbB